MRNVLRRWRRLTRDWREHRWLALDLETNGLDPAGDDILSVAWVPLGAHGIDLHAACAHVVHSPQPLTQSATIHGLDRDRVDGGEPAERVLRALAEAATGCILVAHHARLDRAFLQSAVDRLDLPLEPLAVVDTLGLERRRLRIAGHDAETLPANALSLAACRARHGLPAVAGHDALADAVACAELFLAQAWQACGRGRLSAASLVQWSGMRGVT